MRLSDRRRRPYLFYDTATGVCSTCLRRVEAKIILDDRGVIFDKWCPTHGREQVLLADDIAYWRWAREKFIVAAEMPRHFSTPMHWGCPYDCGLCPDHQQHSCLTLVDITDHCNLTCPVCYAVSSPRQKHRSMQDIRAMLDAAVRAEGAPDIVQISGGEPTTHPRFFEVLAEARERPIRHLMVNTNGIVIATEDGFAERLSAFTPDFEVYLQFDSLRDEVHDKLRGARLGRIRRQALEQLEAHNVSTTLVVTLERGLNDDEIGDILEFALQWRCVRGVVLQPVQEAGRFEGYDPAVHRLTLTEVRRRVAEQWSRITARDLIPVPCHPDGLSMAYALKIGGDVFPLTRYVDADTLLQGAEATISFERMPDVRKQLTGLFSTGIGPDAQAERLGTLLCCLPQVQTPSGLSYENIFRVVIMKFMDARDLDLRSVKRSCVTFAQPDGRLIPFDAYNLLYRGAAAGRLAELRAELAR